MTLRALHRLASLLLIHILISLLKKWLLVEKQNKNLTNRVLARFFH